MNSKAEFNRLRDAVRAATWIEVGPGQTFALFWGGPATVTCLALSGLAPVFMDSVDAKYFGGIFVCALLLLGIFAIWRKGLLSLYIRAASCFVIAGFLGYLAWSNKHSLVSLACIGSTGAALDAAWINIQGILLIRRIDRPEYRTARDKVESWIAVLTEFPARPDTVKISTSSFWRGKSSFLIAHHENYWIVEESQKPIYGQTKAGYSIFPNDEVHLVEYQGQRTLVLANRRLTIAPEQDSEMTKLSVLLAS